MKKITLLAAMAAAVVTANAQYTIDPTTDAFIKSIDNPSNYVIYPLALGDAAHQALKAAGFEVNDVTIVNDDTAWLYVWNDTFTAGDGSYPDADFSGEGYTDLTVGTVGWSGAGFCVLPTANWDNSNLGDETILHVNARTSNGLESVGLIVMDGGIGTAKGTPAKVSLGNSAFVDNGTAFPLVGGLGEEWTGLSIKFSDLKKLCPSFSVQTGKGWDGNVLSFLAGGVTGKNIAFSNVFLATPKAADGIEGVAVDNENAPVVYYNLQGVEVANPTAGLYIKVQGNNVEKVLVK